MIEIAINSNKSNKTGLTSLTLAAVLITSSLASVSLFMTSGVLKEAEAANKTQCELSQIQITSANYNQQKNEIQASLNNPANASLEDIRVSLSVSDSQTISTSVPYPKPGKSTQVVFAGDNVSRILNQSNSSNKAKITAMPIRCPTISSKISLEIN